MGLIKDLIINAAGEAAKEAVKDVAIGAAYGAASVASTACDVLSKGIDKVDKATKKVGVLASKISQPIIKKKIEELSKECDSLFLISYDSKNNNKSTSVYTSSADFVFSANKANKRNFDLKTISDDVVASYVYKKKLFSDYYLIETKNNDSYELRFNGSLKDKVNYELSNGIKIIRNNILGNYVFYYEDKKIASLNSKFMTSIDYVLSIFDDSLQLEIILMTIGMLNY